MMDSSHGKHMYHRQDLSKRGGMSKGNKTHKTNAHFSKFMIFIFKIFKIYFDEASPIPLNQKKFLYDNGIS